MKRRGQPSGAAHARAVLTDAEVRRIRELAVEHGWSVRRLAAQYEVGRSTIQHIVRGERYPDAGGPIRRLEAVHRVGRRDE